MSEVGALPSLELPGSPSGSPRLSPHPGAQRTHKDKRGQACGSFS